MSACLILMLFAALFLLAAYGITVVEWLLRKAFP